MTFNVTRMRTVAMLTMGIAAVILAGCKLRQSYSVPKDKFLLKKNDITVSGDKIGESELSEVLRQQPNLSTIGIKFRLISFNLIDSTAVAEKRIKKVNSLRQKNLRKRKREYRINTRRRNRALRRDRTEYVYKTVKLKDTLTPNISLRERMKYKFGEAPVIVDTFLVRKSREQLHVYLHKKGYYYDTITSYLDTVKNKLKNRKIVAHYKVVTGPRYYIDSVYVKSSTNPGVTSEFLKYIKEEPDDSPLNTPFYRFLNAKDAKDSSRRLKVPFDSDLLNDYRNKIAKHMRNEAFYGFSPAHVIFSADTNKADMSVKLAIVFTERMIKKEGYADSLVPVQHQVTTVRNVFFHISDTSSYEGDFSWCVEKDLQLPLKKDGFLQTIDTLHYAELYKKVKLPSEQQNKRNNLYYKSAVNRNLFGQPKDSVALDKYREATFLYNGRLFLQPGVMEAQNYLEQTNYYKEYYVDRTYNRLLQLNIFSLVKPVIEEIPNTSNIDVHYYLIPAEKQSFGFEPRFTNSNGFLGVAASINYANKNIFRTGWNTNISLGGGFESQPPIFDETVDGKKISGRSFNTFEIGPTFKIDLPGLFPRNIAKLGKRSRPRTILSTAYNYQQRTDFTRGIFQLNYLWKFYVGKTQIVSVGLPTTSVIKFVAMNKKPAFEAKINALNDLFLRNAYSDQLIWEDLKFVYDYDNRDRDNKNPRLRITFNTTFNLAGNFLSLFKKNLKQDSSGHYQVFGVTYSQFSLIDTKFITYYNLTKTRILAFRTLAGVGLPTGNTPTSLPYDYSFFAGGSNDNRGWRARSLGPGSYKYYLDDNRTATQIGDIRLEASFEFRFGTGLFKHAFFTDLGNIWTMNEDVNRQGGQFSKNFYKELGFAVGYGLRLDFEFFILRLDAGLPLTNPAMPEGSRWIFQSRKPYYEVGYAAFGTDFLSHLPSTPFAPQFHLGIGLPF